MEPIDELHAPSHDYPGGNAYTVINHRALLDTSEAFAGGPPICVAFRDMMEKSLRRSQFDLRRLDCDYKQVKAMLTKQYGPFSRHSKLRDYFTTFILSKIVSQEANLNFSYVFITM